MSGKRYYNEIHEPSDYVYHGIPHPTSSQKRPTHSRYEPGRSEPQPGEKLRLTTNSYSITRSKDDCEIYFYHLQITINERFRNVPASVLGRHFVSKSIRNLLMNDILPQLVEQENGKQIPVIIDIKAESIFSLKPLKHHDGRPVVDGCFQFRDLRLTTELLKCLHVDICLKYKQTFEPSTFIDSMNFITSVIHHQLTIDMTRFGSVYFKLVDIPKEASSNRLDLISQEVKGISISGIKETIDSKKLVAISSPHAYITGSHRLIDLLATFIENRPIEGLKLDHSTKTPPHALKPEIRSIKGDEDWFKSFASILTGYKCCAEKSNWRVILRFELSDESASCLTMDEESGATVQQYYGNLDVHLNYPNLPCLKSRYPEHPFFPLELCTLIPGQKVPIFRLSSAAKNRLSLLNKPKPEHSKQLSVDAKARVLVTSSNQLEAFGVKISDEPVQATGTILQKPTLAYGDISLRPRSDYWESGCFQAATNLLGSWCVVNASSVDRKQEEIFFKGFCVHSRKFGVQMDEPNYLEYPRDLLMERGGLDDSISKCLNLTNGNLRLIMFVIDSHSSQLNRLIHLKFGTIQGFTASCLRVDSILNYKLRNSIYRTLIHKLNTRLGGVNVTYHQHVLSDLKLSSDDLLVIGLDVTHPDNELTGVSIVGCAYTYDRYLFKHRSVVWPQAARTEIIARMDSLMEYILIQYCETNRGRLPRHILIYRDGVSREEFEKVKEMEISKIDKVLDQISRSHHQMKPILSFIIAQKRHTMRFYYLRGDPAISNPPSGTLVDRDVVSKQDSEFYLYSNTGPQATSRPLHYHVIERGLSIETLQNLTYYLCFNFGKCSGSLSMPSSLRYAHNAAYDARNHVIESRSFQADAFYPCKFFC